jgi:hypothetical protein
LSLIIFLIVPNIEASRRTSKVPALKLRPCAWYVKSRENPARQGMKKCSRR